MILVILILVTVMIDELYYKIMSSDADVKNANTQNI